MNKNLRKRKAFVDKKFCVACGTCIKECPMNAITIKNGIFADINLDKCVGCGKCSKVCPATTITIKELLGDDNYEEK